MKLLCVKRSKPILTICLLYLIAGVGFSCILHTDKGPAIKELDLFLVVLFFWPFMVLYMVWKGVVHGVYFSCRGKTFYKWRGLR